MTLCLIVSHPSEWTVIFWSKSYGRWYKPLLLFSIFILYLKASVWIQHSAHTIKAFKISESRWVIPYSLQFRNLKLGIRNIRSNTKCVANNEISWSACRLLLHENSLIFWQNRDLQSCINNYKANIPIETLGVLWKKSLNETTSLRANLTF